MKIIAFDEIKGLNISPVMCYQWVNDMIINKKNAILPPKISMHPTDDVFCNVMPCILDSHVGGVKVVNRYPERKPSLDSRLLLLDMKSGDFLALMDANWITAMRTGAVAAHSIMYLAKYDFTEIAILGLGNTARATLLVLASVVTKRQLHVKLLRYKGQENLFMNRFANFSNIVFSCVDTNEELVKGSDVVISCATFFEKDICPDHCFDEGVLVVPVHTRGFTNCDLFFDKVYADDYSHVQHFKNFNKFKYFAEVCDVVNGNAVGRENDKERILAYNIGLAIHDINYANHIYQMMKDDDKLIDIDMHNPTDKFWV